MRNSMLGAAMEEDRLESFSERQLRWFNELVADDPTANADFQYYGQMAGWTLEECVALSLGKDPAQVRWDRVERFVLQSDFADAYKRRRSLVMRAREAGELSDFVLAGDFIDWAKRCEIDLPAKLVEQVRRRQAQEDTTDKPLHTRERASVMKLLCGMAICRYGYDPRLKKNSATTKIANDLRLLNLDLDEDTIRKFLDEAKVLVAWDDLPPLTGKPNSE